MSSIAPPAHNRNNETTDSWITPKYIVDDLGPFDLDPCECAHQPWPCASRSYTERDDGLAHSWNGMVWLNPPYGRQTGVWLDRLSKHGNGIALVFARTDTAMFFDHVWPRASAYLFLKGRLHFCRPDGTPAKHNSGGPSVLIAYGEVATERLNRSSLEGHLFLDPSSS